MTSFPFYMLWHNPSGLKSWLDHSCVTLGELLDFSVLCFPYLQRSHLARVALGLVST